MAYTAKTFNTLLGLEGFSDQLLNNHFTLYQGYVTNVNKLFELQGELIAAGKTIAPEFAETRRRLGWEWNGMRLHEYYFGGLSKTPKLLSPSSALARRLKADFGSTDAWEKEFRAIAALRGMGWTILTYDREADRLLNVWVNEHDVGHPAGCAPLLALDVFEHAYMIDYGLKRADYIGACMAALDWASVEERFKRAG